MPTETVRPVSGNANQAVANDDFEAYQREANKADLAAKFGPAKEKPAAAKEPAAEKQEPKQPERAAAKPKGAGSLSHNELRARVRELEAENQRLAAAKPPEKKAEEVKVEPETKQPEALRARPTPDDKIGDKPKYANWQKYEDDLLAWNKEEIFRELDERSAKKTQEAQIEAVNQTIEQSWKERVTKSREAHEDFDEVALGPDGPGKLIQPGSLVDEWIMDSEHGAELLYYFGQNPSELLKFENVAGKNPTERRANARRALVKLEDKLTAAPDDKKTEPEKAEPEKKEEVRATRTPKPSSEVGGRGNSLPDPVQAAIADGSDAATRRYIDEQNRRDIRAKFGDARR
jgi:hypothetical protein